MISFLKNKLFFSIDKTWLWILISLFFKSIIFLFCLSQHHFSEIDGFWGSLSGDAESYMIPLENYINHGSYDPDFRAPGLAPVYLPLRLFFSIAVSCNIFLLLQLILSSLAVYVLAKTVYNVSKSVFLFYTVFYVYLLSTFSNIYDVYFLTESMCTSFTVFFIYFLVQYSETKKNKYLIICSLFFTWLIFLRPIYILFALFIIIYFFLSYRRKFLDLKQAIVGLFIFFSSFILVDGLWIVRNYKIHGEFMPLRKSVYYERANNDYFESLARFVQAWGGDIMFWNPEAEIRWFNYKADFVKNDYEPQIPDYIYTSVFNRDTLLKLKKMIGENPERTNVSKDSIHIYDEIFDKCIQYELAVQNERPFVFHVVSRFRLFKKFVIHSGTYNLFEKSFSQLNIFQKAIKLFYTALYITTLFLSLLGIFIFPYRNKMLIFFIPVLYSLIMIPFVFKFCEFRYLVPAYPFLEVSACFLLNYYFLKIRTYLKR